MNIQEIKERAEACKLEFCRDAIRIAGMRATMMLVVRKMHKVDYNDLKRRWCDIANNLTDDECQVMWGKPLEAKLPARLFDKELDHYFHVDELIRAELDKLRVACEEQAHKALDDIFSFAG